MVCFTFQNQEYIIYKHNILLSVQLNFLGLSKVFTVQEQSCRQFIMNIAQYLN